MLFESIILSLIQQLNKYSQLTQTTYTLKKDIATKVYTCRSVQRINQDFGNNDHHRKKPDVKLN